MPKRAFWSLSILTCEIWNWLKSKKSTGLSIIKEMKTAWHCYCEITSENCKYIRKSKQQNLMRNTFPQSRSAASNLDSCFGGVDLRKQTESEYWEYFLASYLATPLGPLWVLGPAVSSSEESSFIAFKSWSKSPGNVSIGNIANYQNPRPTWKHAPWSRLDWSRNTKEVLTNLVKVL